MHMVQMYQLWKMKAISSSGILKTIYYGYIMVVIYWYLVRKNNKAFKFHKNNSS